MRQRFWFYGGFGLGVLLLVLGSLLLPRHVGAAQQIAGATSQAVATAATPTNTATPIPTETPGCTAGGNLVASPNVGSSDNHLYGVAATGPADIWAVGYYYNNGFPSLILHGDGSTWTVANPASGGVLRAVAARTVTDAWAVGDTDILHWDGTAWTLAAHPVGVLNGVVALAANDAWAGGTDSGNTLSQLEHWNGSSWTVAATPNIGIIQAVAASAANDVWAVGANGSLHWNGTAWIALTGGAGNGVIVLAANNAWSVGGYFTGTNTRTIAQHWDGSAWSVVPSPNAGTGANILYGIAAGGANDLWAVGEYDDPDYIRKTLLLHWDGSAWTLVTGSNPGQNNSLYAITAVGANDVWAVGQDYSQSVYQTLTMHYTGPCIPTSTVTGTPPTATQTRTPTHTPTPTQTRTPTNTPTDTPTPTFTNSPTPTVTGTLPTATPKLTVPPTATFTPTVTGTPPTATWTPMATFTPPQATATGQPTAPTATSSPAAARTATSTPLPSTATPSPPSPTVVPTGAPSPSATSTVPATTTPPTATPAPQSPTPALTPCTIRFSDVQQADYFYAPVLGLACRGVIAGYADGTFRPFSTTTRAQMVKIVVLGFGRSLVAPPAGHYTFADVPQAHPFFTVIETAAADGIVSGYGCGAPMEPCDTQHRPYFRPAAAVTRAQLAKITVIAAGGSLVTPARNTFADVEPESVFYPFVQTAACRGIVSGYTCGAPNEPCDTAQRPYFRPANPATRGQIAKIVYGALTTGGTCP